MTLNIPTNDDIAIFESGKHILMSKFNFDKSIRLIGLTVSNLIYPEDPMQLSMDI